MKTFLLLLASIPVFLSCTPKAAPVTAQRRQVVRTTADPGNMEASILQYINQYRRSKGLNDLVFLDAANEQAYQHSKDMGSGRTAFGHDGFEQRVAAIKRSMDNGFIPASAENVAEGQLSAREVVDGWLHSPGHKRNIEGNYNLTGIGVAKGRDGALYFTQIFIRK